MHKEQGRDPRAIPSSHPHNSRGVREARPGAAAAHREDERHRVDGFSADLPWRQSGQPLQPAAGRVVTGTPGRVALSPTPRTWPHHTAPRERRVSIMPQRA